MLQSARGDRKVQLTRQSDWRSAGNLWRRSAHGPLTAAKKAVSTSPSRLIAAASSRPPATASGKIVGQELARRSHRRGLAVGPVDGLFHRKETAPARPSGRPTSAEQSHPLDPVTAATTILNDVHSFRVRGAFLELHCLVANNAAKQIDERALIVVGRRVHFPLRLPNGGRLSKPLRKSGAPFIQRAIKIKEIISHVQPCALRLAPVCRCCRL